MFFLRALVVYPLVILLFRLLGRGLQFASRPYDVAVQVLIGSAAANLIISADVEPWRAFTALGALAALHTVLSFLSLWNPLKKYLVGQPVPIVENGRILKANLIRNQLSVEEVLAALREKGYHNPSDVEFALLEASARISVVPRSQARPVTPRDLNLSTGYDGASVWLIADDRVDQENPKKVGLSYGWLLTELIKRGAEGPEGVLIASLNTKGQLFVVRNQDVPFLQSIFRGVQAKTAPGLPTLLGTGASRPPPPGIDHPLRDSLISGQVLAPPAG